MSLLKYGLVAAAMVVLTVGVMLWLQGASAIHPYSTGCLNLLGHQGIVTHC